MGFYLEYLNNMNFKILGMLRAIIQLYYLNLVELRINVDVHRPLGGNILICKD